jgi:hypothetical protein
LIDESDARPDVQVEQLVVGDDDQRIDVGHQISEAFLRGAQAPAALEVERPGDDGHGERAGLLRRLRDDRGGAGARAAARSTTARRSARANPCSRRAVPSAPSARTDRCS